MSQDSLKVKTAKGIIWSSIERFSVQFIQLIIQILIARILTPDDFGIIGMLAIFLAVSQSFIDSGFSNALIRKVDRTEVDNSTVFYFNIVVGIVFYTILYFTAPLIAKFYNTPILTPITRVISVGVLFNSLSIVQRAILTSKIDFKTQAKASLIAVVISGAVGLYLAHTGYGVWALVGQAVINYGVNTIVLWILTKWHPIMTFSWESLCFLSCSQEYIWCCPKRQAILMKDLKNSSDFFLTDSSAPIFRITKRFAAYYGCFLTMII